MSTGTTAMMLDGTSEKGLGKIILASAVGTMIEWYDFYIFGSMRASRRLALRKSASVR